VTTETKVEAVAWRDDLVSVFASATDASAVSLTWLASTDITPEQVKAWMCETVDNTVAADAFSGELHSIAEDESGQVVAFTGCGPKSAANAKFLIWCAHFVLKHGDSLLDHASAITALEGEVERLSNLLAEGGRRLIDENMRANAAERRVAAAEELARKWEEQASLHGVRQFTGNDHLLFANELKAALTKESP
jgi:hypothetical protein